MILPLGIVTTLQTGTASSPNLRIRELYLDYEAANRLAEPLRWHSQELARNLPADRSGAESVRQTAAPARCATYAMREGGEMAAGSSGRL